MSSIKRFFFGPSKAEIEAKEKEEKEARRQKAVEVQVIKRLGFFGYFSKISKGVFRRKNVTTPIKSGRKLRNKRRKFKGPLQRRTSHGLPWIRKPKKLGAKSKIPTLVHPSLVQHPKSVHLLVKTLVKLKSPLRRSQSTK